MESLVINNITLKRLPLSLFGICYDLKDEGISVSIFNVNICKVKRP
ncbi:MAG: hypothetical protein ACERKV_01290 [Clostridiaceae bacterium]